MERGNAVYEAWAKEHGLSYHELLAAISLWEGACTQREICRQWQLAKQTVYAVIQNFIKRGWLCLKASETDRRNKTARLTQLGRDQIGPVIQALREQECRVWEKLGESRGTALIENTALYIQLFEERKV